MIHSQNNPPMQTYAVLTCPLCFEPGRVLFHALNDFNPAHNTAWNIRLCARCLHCWLDPRPQPESIGQLYTEYHTHAVPAQPPRQKFAAIRAAVGAIIRKRDYGYEQLHPHIANPLAHLLSFLPLMRDIWGIDIMGLRQVNGGTLLDVGCGNGRFLGKMQALGWHVTGTEIDPYAARMARRQGLTVFEGVLEQLDLPAGRFDVVTVSHVIEHVDDPVLLLKACYRLLRPGGTVVVTTPNNQSLCRRWFGRSWRGLEVPRHFHIFSQQSLEQVVRRAGFAIASSTSSVRLTRDIYLASRLIQQNYSQNVVQHQLPISERLAAITMQLVEHFLQTYLSLDVAEELFCIGQKHDT